ncbi:MAG: hypothetical protein HC848_01900 [Limnobacter sp.]|nr:hypothetical protein [Limnobacter sp.]
MKNQTSGLSSIQYVLGQQHSIENLNQLKADEGLAETLMALGLAHYAQSTKSTLELAAEAVQKTIATSNVNPAQIDACVYATNTLDLKEQSPDGIVTLLANLGLSKAMINGVFGWECANLFLAWQNAINLIHTDMADTVLVITADRCLDPNQRLVPPGISVLSDGACAALVTRETSKSDFILRALSHVSKPGMTQIDPNSDTQNYFVGVGNGLNESAQKALVQSKFTLTDINQVCMNNYNLSLLNTFSRKIGFSPKQLYRKNIGRFGHCWAADAWINLSDYQESGELQAGQGVALMGTSPFHWSSAVVTKV